MKSWRLRAPVGLRVRDVELNDYSLLIYASQPVLLLLHLSFLGCFNLLLELGLLNHSVIQEPAFLLIELESLYSRVAGELNVIADVFIGNL